MAGAGAEGRHPPHPAWGDAEQGTCDQPRESGGSCLHGARAVTDGQTDRPLLPLSITQLGTLRYGQRKARSVQTQRPYNFPQFPVPPGSGPTAGSHLHPWPVPSSRTGSPPPPACLPCPSCEPCACCEPPGLAPPLPPKPGPPSPSLLWRGLSWSHYPQPQPPPSHPAVLLRTPCRESGVLGWRVSLPRSPRTPSGESSLQGTLPGWGSHCLCYLPAARRLSHHSPQSGGAESDNYYAVRPLELIF